MIAWAFAAAAEPLHLPDVWASVQATHPLLEAARTRADLAAEERRAAAGALDPVLSGGVASQVGQYQTQSVSVKSPLGTWWGGDVTAGWRRGVGTFDPYEGAAKTEASGEWVVGFDVSLLRDAWTDRKRATRAVADRGVAVADAEVRQRELELLRSAGHRWAEWEAAGQRLRVAERLLALAEGRDRALGTQQALGDVPALVRLDNTRLVLERRERLVQARRAFEAASLELGTWLRDGAGRPLLPGEEQLLAEFLPPDPLADGDRVALALDRRPEPRRLGAQRDQVGVERRLQANQSLPALDVVGKTYLPLDEEAPDEVEVGVVAEWTALARTARARRAQADANLLRIDAELAFARDRIAADVRDAESACRAADARVEVVRSLVATARAVEEGERAKFALGDSNLIFVNQREIATADAEALLVDAVAAAHRARVDLGWATGTL